MFKAERPTRHCMSPDHESHNDGYEPWIGREEMMRNLHLLDHVPIVHLSHTPDIPFIPAIQHRYLVPRRPTLLEAGRSGPLAAPFRLLPRTIRAAREQLGLHAASDTTNPPSRPRRERSIPQRLPRRSPASSGNLAVRFRLLSRSSRSFARRPRLALDRGDVPPIAKAKASRRPASLRNDGQQW